MPRESRRKQSNKHSYSPAMNIQALLNPANVPSRRVNGPTAVIPISSPVVSAPQSMAQTSRPKTKTAKDEPAYRPQQPVGPVNFPAHEPAEGTELYREHRRHVLYPTPKEGIKNYASRIPYSSDKKKFKTNTGREAFDGAYFFLLIIGLTLTCSN